jgi:biopolymer transport protein ExbD
MRRTGRRKNLKMGEVELDLLPMMNVFIVLIPMLLTSAVFLKVTVIDTNVPNANAAPAVDAGESLSLAITIKDDYFVVEGKGIDSRVITRKDADAPAKLAAALADVELAHPDNQDVIIISEPKTRYQDIIAVMDVARASGLPSASLLGADAGE